MKCNKKVPGLWFLFLLLFCSCSLNAKTRTPYAVHGEIVMEESRDYQIAGLDLYLLNNSEKSIKNFTLVFFVYDSDGNPPEGMRSNLVIPIEAEILANSVFRTCINLDKYFSIIPDEPYQVDFVYLSKITYADGTEWEDPFGIACF